VIANDFPFTGIRKALPSAYCFIDNTNKTRCGTAGMGWLLALTVVWTNAQSRWEQDMY
jgi:hypothetical protein